MGINRNTEIKKNRIAKNKRGSYDNKRRTLLKIHFFINLRQNIIFIRANFCFIKQNVENIVKML